MLSDVSSLTEMHMDYVPRDAESAQAEPLLIMTWLWFQQPRISGYDAEKINLWAQQMRAHLRMPHRLACVTDHPQGIDSSIEIIPMPHDFDHVKVATWSEARGLPQCYRRLAIFAPDAQRRFGAARLVSMDCDMLAFADLDALFLHHHDFCMLRGTAAGRPYNGSMVQMSAGARPEVFTRFTQAGATLARSKHIGSDQAWVSHVLGKGEATWSPAQGVYFKRLLPGSQWRPPANMRLLFFPGPPKPWEIADSVPFVRAAYERARRHAHAPKQPDAEAPLASATRQAPPPLYAYDDPKAWGNQFAQAAAAKGLDCRLFTHALPRDERAFVRLDQQSAQRIVSKLVVRRLHDRGNITLPTYRESCWYDDKIAQHELLAAWMPETHIVRESASARRLAGEVGFPLISKSAEGAGSQNVRVLADAVTALGEIKRAFGAGIPISYGRRQHGYIYWQRIVTNNPCDYRICIVGPYLYGLKRWNRPGTLFASGSGNAEPLKFDDERARAAAALAVHIARALGTQWMAFDIVFDERRALVLEMSSAWTMQAYRDCRAFTHELTPTARSGADSFAVAVEVLTAMGRSPGEEERA